MGSLITKIDASAGAGLSARGGEVASRGNGALRMRLGAAAMAFMTEHAQLAARTYRAAADHYGLPSLSFWDRFGAETVTRLALEPGMAVLDMCCGAGASAITAARAVGTTGRVLGVDVAEPLLDQARARAARAGLANIEFRHGEATCTGVPEGSFDAVTCVFGVFFAADIAAFAAEMWRLARRRGALAVTTWGGLFEPANSHFSDAVGGGAAAGPGLQPEGPDH